MVSTTKTVMKIKHVGNKKKNAATAPLKAEKKVAESPAKVKTTSAAPAPTRKTKQKSLKRKKVTKSKQAPAKKITSPEDAILQSAAVDPDIDKASKPAKKAKKSPTKREDLK